MMKLVATAVAAVLLQASPTLAGGLELIKSGGEVSRQSTGPSLSSAEIAALQYHEEADPAGQSLSYRCQTRAGVFNISPRRPIDTSCAVDGLPGFMLP